MFVLFQFSITWSDRIELWSRAYFPAQNQRAFWIQFDDRNIYSQRIRAWIKIQITTFLFFTYKLQNVLRFILEKFRPQSIHIQIYAIVIGRRFRVLLSGSIYRTFSFLSLRTLFDLFFSLPLLLLLLFSLRLLYFQYPVLSRSICLCCTQPFGHRDLWMALFAVAVYFSRNERTNEKKKNKFKSILRGVCNGAHGLSKYSIPITNFPTFSHLLSCALCRSRQWKLFVGFKFMYTLLSLEKTPMETHTRAHRKYIRFARAQ